jgi:hypothetical protein
MHAVLQDSGTGGFGCPREIIIIVVVVVSLFHQVSVVED